MLHSVVGDHQQWRSISSSLAQRFRFSWSLASFFGLRPLSAGWEPAGTSPRVLCGERSERLSRLSVLACEDALSLISSLSTSGERASSEPIKSETRLPRSIQSEPHPPQFSGAYPGSKLCHYNVGSSAGFSRPLVSNCSSLQAR